MNKQLEAKLRSRVQKIIENIIKEDPMEKPDDFSVNTIIPIKPIKIGNQIEVQIGKEVVTIYGSKNTVNMSKDNAKKLANYLIRVLGKV